MKKLLLFIFIFIAIFKLNAQSQCGTDEYDAFMKRTNPQYAAERQKMEQQIYSILKNKENNPNARIMQNDCQQGVFTIPVVVHVIHKGEAVGTGTNISDAQIQSAIKGMNDKWRHIVGDGVDLEIQFALAIRDTNNNATNAITRYDGRVFPNYQSSGVPPNSALVTPLMDSSKAWDRNNYINIWVVDMSEPWGGMSTIGYNYYLFVDYAQMNYSSSTLSHEMGHTFGLKHTFTGSDAIGDNCPINIDCLLDGDGVCDTPPHKVDECNSTSCTGIGDLQNSFKNYMSYCGSTTRFTQGQKERARATLFSNNWNYVYSSVFHGYIRLQELLYSPALIPVSIPLEVSFESIENDLCNINLNNFIPKVKINNFGVNTITNLKIVTYVDDMLFDTKTIITNLVINTTATYSLNVINFSAEGPHNLRFVITEINGNTNDYQSLNNQICKDVLVRNNPINLCNDFENGNTNGFISTGTLIRPIITNVNGCQKNGTKALVYNVFNNANLSRQSDDLLYFSFGLDSVASAYITYDHAYIKSKTNGYLNINPFIYDCEGHSTYLNAITEDILASVNGRDSINPFRPSSCTQWKKDSLNVTRFQGQNNLSLLLDIGFAFPTSLDTTHKCIQNLYFDNICLHKRYIIYSAVNPPGDGNVTYTGGNVVYDDGGTATLIASPYYCKAFKNWTENGVIVSTNPTYTFTVTKNRNLVANFEPQKVNITSSAFPINAGVTFGDGQYLCDSLFTLKARANLDYTFYNWTDTLGNEYSNDSILSWSSNEDKKFIANFKILVRVNTSNANAGGVYGTRYYNYNDSARVSAYINNSCYQFENWTENGVIVSTNPIYKFLVTRNTNLVANFIRKSYTISLSSNPSAGGTITGMGIYPCDTSVKITAHAKYGYNFKYWTDSIGNLISYDSIYTLYVYRNEILTAHFEPKSFLINYTYSANGNSSSTNQYYNSTYTVNADTSISTCFVFRNWTKNGTVVSTNPIYTFVVDGNMNLVANYEKRKYNISLISNFPNAGTLTGSGNFQPNNCDTVITIKAQDNSCYVFKNWSENGVIFSYAPTYIINLKYYYPNNRTLTAIFEPKRYSITLAANPTNGGTVSGAGNFACDSSITVKAKIKTGYKFTNWTEGSTIVSTDSNYTFLINVARSLKANFSLVTGIKQTTINEISKVYPNPVSDVLQVEIRSKQSTTLTLNIIDIKGSLLESKTLSNTKGTINTSFDVSKLAKGNYILNLYDEEGMASDKFVVQ